MNFSVSDECDISKSVELCIGRKRRDKSFRHTFLIVLIYEKIPSARLEVNIKCKVAFPLYQTLLVRLIAEPVFGKRLSNLTAGAKIYLSWQSHTSCKLES